jgi:hypothetical protein
MGKRLSQRKDVKIFATSPTSKKKEEGERSKFVCLNMAAATAAISLDQARAELTHARGATMRLHCTRTFWPAKTRFLADGRLSFFAGWGSGKERRRRRGHTQPPTPWAGGGAGDFGGDCNTPPSSLSSFVGGVSCRHIIKSPSDRDRPRGPATSFFPLT